MSPQASEIREDELQGFKYFRRIARLLERLHKAGCQRDRAGNRTLHMDQYMALVLLAMFNPICQSLRGIQRASALKKVQRVLGVPRASLGSLSEAAAVFDASLLEGILGELVRELKPVPHDARLDQVDKILTLVDGTYLTALPALVHWALWQEEKRGKRAAKAHFQFEVLKGVPVAATITSGQASETQVLRERLEPGRLYVIDRGYAAYSLFQAILAGREFLRRPRGRQRRGRGHRATAALGHGAGGRRGPRRHRVARLQVAAGRPAKAGPTDRGRLQAAPQTLGQERTRRPRTGVGASPRDRQAGTAGRGRRPPLRGPLADRDLLSHAQASAGMPALA